MNIQDIIKREDVHIIDVREEIELQQGQIPQALHMPLSRFDSFIAKLREMNGPKVFYCRSGNRSGQATKYCQSLGIHDVHNGGSYVLMQAYMIGSSTLR